MKNAEWCKFKKKGSEIFEIREIERYASEVHRKYSREIEKPHHLF
jgi:hypothetical protein